MKKILIVLIVIYILAILCGCSLIKDKEFQQTSLTNTYRIVKVNSYESTSFVKELVIELNGSTYSYQNSESYNPWVGIDFSNKDNLEKICEIPRNEINELEYIIFSSLDDKEKLFILLEEKGEGLQYILKNQLSKFPSFDILNTVQMFEIHEESEISNQWEVMEDGSLISNLLSSFQNEGKINIADIRDGGFSLYRIIMKSEHPDHFYVSIDIIGNKNKYYLQTIKPYFYNEISKEVFDRLCG